MTDTVAFLLLAIIELAGLLMVPLGLPGLWVMMLGLLGYGWFTDFQTVGNTSKTPLERLRALEYLRRMAYGPAATARLQRVLSVAQLGED